MAPLESQQVQPGGVGASPIAQPNRLLKALGYPFGWGKPVPVSAPESGVAGTANFNGQILKEENQALQGQSAYGYPSSATWGEWERLLRTDPAVTASHEFIKAQIRDARVTVLEADEEAQPDRALAKAQADFVRWVLLSRCAPGWAELKNQFVAGLVPGFALFEKVWEPVEHPALPGGSGIGLVKLAERLPNSVMINGWVEQQGELAAIRQMGQRVDGSFGEVDLPAGKVLLLSWNRNGNNYLGHSAYRAVWYLVKVRAELVKLIGISLSREAAGVPTAVSKDPDASLSAEQRSRLEKLLANIQYHENASLVMPKGWDVKWIYSPGANKGHVVEAWNQLGHAILQTVFAQQLSLGVNNTGSRSVGEVHDGTADSFVSGVLAWIEGVINGNGSRPYEGLVRDIIDLNWGTQAVGAYPQVKLELKQAKIGIAERAAAVQTLANAGALTITAEDENTLREALGLAPINEDEREAIKAQKVAQQQAMMQSVDATKPPERNGKDAKSSAIGGKKFSSVGAFAPSRPLRFAEKRLDLNAQADYLANSRERFESKVRPAVVEMLVAAQPALKAAMADGDPSDVSDVPLDDSKLRAVVREFLQGARVEGARQVNAETAKAVRAQIVAKRGDGFAMAEGGAGDEKHPDSTATDEETDDLIDAQEALATKRIRNRLAQDLENEAFHAVRTGGDATGVIQRVVMRQVETAAFKGDAGLIVTTAWNLGREEAAAKLGGVAFVQYSAILDGNVCGPCSLMDGKEWAFGSEDHDAHLPPNRDCEGGDRCRCMLVYLTRDEAGRDGGDE